MNNMTIVTGTNFGKLMEMIESVIIPEGYEVIKNAAFAGYYINLKEVTCPSTLKTIEDAGFSCCSKLENLRLNEGLITMGRNAISNCPAIKSIEIPSTVQSIGDNALGGCTSLTEVIIHKPEGSIAGAPWGATNATITWDDTNSEPSN